MISRLDRRFTLLSTVWLFVVFLSTSDAPAQTAQFTYRSKLTDSGAPINAPYDFVLTLWDELTNGNHVGTALNLQNAPMVDGIFTVNQQQSEIALQQNQSALLKPSVCQRIPESATRNSSSRRI